MSRKIVKERLVQLQAMSRKIVKDRFAQLSRKVQYEQ
jgi:hypothetical protein